MAVVLAVTQCLGVMELTLCPTESWNFTRGGDTGQAGRCLELGRVLEGFCVNKCPFYSQLIMREAGLEVWCGLEWPLRIGKGKSWKRRDDTSLGSNTELR